MALANATPFTVTVTFDSDWYTGTGGGRHGSVDGATYRDHDGLPALRGKGFADLLRDTAESIAAALDAGRPDRPWAQWVVALFGSQPAADQMSGTPDPRPATAGRPGAPIPAALQSPTLRLPQDQRDYLLGTTIGGRNLGAGLYGVRPGVKLSATRTAVEDHLRSIEVAAAGLMVQASWAVTFPGLGAGAALPSAVQVLLLGAITRIERVGGKRRRGLGRCRADVPATGPGAKDTPGDAAAMLAAVLAAHPPGSIDAPGSDLWTAPPPPRPMEVAGGRGESGLVHAYDLVIELGSPLIADAGTVGNLVRTHDHIPGSMLLPLVSKALGGASAELIAAGRLRVSDATVDIGGRRALPIPRAVQMTKRAAVQDGATLTVTTHGIPAGARLKPLTGYYVQDPAGRVRIARPGIVGNVHAVIDDGQQRPTSTGGGLFVYQGIAAGTVLRAEVHLPQGQPFQKKHLEGEQSIGRSRKDDYGSLRITVADAAPSPTPGRDHTGTVTVALTADVLLPPVPRRPGPDPATRATEPPQVDRCVPPSAEALAAELSHLTGLDLQVAAVEGDTPTSLTGVRRRESWHTRWNLPRPSLVALAGGSVITLRIPPGKVLPEHTVAAIERRGIGLRRAEGFGGISIDPAALRTPTLTLHVPEPAATPAGGPPAAPRNVPQAWQELHHRLWGQELDRAARIAALNPELRGKYLPAGVGRAQAGALRLLVADDHDNAGELRARLRRWAAHTAAIQTGADSQDRWQNWGDSLRHIWELAGTARGIFEEIGVDQAVLNRSPTVRDALRGPTLATFFRAMTRAASQTDNRRPAPTGTPAAGVGEQ